MGEYHDEDLFMSKMLSLGPTLGYNCTDCEFKSLKKDNMRHHIESSHLNLTYNCEVCGKAYKSYKGRFHFIYLEKIVVVHYIKYILKSKVYFSKVNSRIWIPLFLGIDDVLKVKINR